MSGRAVPAAMLAGAMLAFAAATAGWGQEPPPAPAATPDVWPEAALDDDEAAAFAREAMPFTQQQIELIGRLLEQTRAAAARAGGPPPTGRVRRITMDPATATAPAIVLRRGYISTVSVTDLTGAAWPIEEVLADAGFLPEAGAGGARPDGAAHLVYFAPSVAHAHGNAALKLRGLAAPVVLALHEAPSAADVDFRVDLRVPLIGPTADAAALTRPLDPGAGDTGLIDLLHGTAPASAVRLEVDGGAARAWRAGADLLLLSRGEVLSPAPVAAERGAGGVWAYRLPATPAALMSVDGRETRLSFRVPALTEEEIAHHDVPRADRRDRGDGGPDARPEPPGG